MERGGLNQSDAGHGGDFTGLWTESLVGVDALANGRSRSENRPGAPAPVVYRDDREVVFRSAALTACIQAATRSNSMLLLQTAAQSRLSLSVTILLASASVHWVVEIGGELFDGVSGEPVRATDPRSDRTGEYTAADEGGADRRPEPAVEQLVVSATLHHRAGAHIELGHALEQLAQAFTGAPPTGWGVDEPATQLWSRTSVTSIARRRMPEPTVLAVVGNRTLPFTAQLTVSRTSRGVDEDLVALGLGEPHTAPNAIEQALAGLAEDSSLAFAVVHRRPGRLDLTTEFGARTASTPTAILFGPRAVRELGLDALETAGGTRPRRLGRSRMPSLLWSLDRAAGSGWRQLDTLLRHIGPARVAAATDSRPVGRPARDGGRRG
jgi:hypothetical protein